MGRTESFVKCLCSATARNRRMKSNLHIGFFDVGLREWGSIGKNSAIIRQKLQSPIAEYAVILPAKIVNGGKRAPLKTNEICGGD